MGRQDLIEHIEAEIESETNWTDEEQPKPVFCENCGEVIVGANEVASAKQDYVIHRVPSPDDSGMQNAFYCGPSCLDSHMAELFSSADKNSA